MSERWELIRAVFVEAVSLSAEGRSALLDQQFGADPSARHEVESLLEHADQADSFLEVPAPNLSALPAAGTYQGPETPGETVGPYRLVRIVGEGAFGVVWLAERLAPYAQEVALKIIKPGMDSGAVLARFEQERQALAVLSHPNVARVIDGGATNLGRPYFVMEYVEGRCITRYSDAQQLSIAARLELFRSVCDAVQHAHHKGVIHRDLKPSNILVSDVNGRPIAKVIDFGVAKCLDPSTTAPHTLTTQGHLVGTPEYMSPEQASGGAIDIDATTDVYSLGVVLYELLTGRLPIDSRVLRQSGLSEVQRIIREVDPVKPSASVLLERVPLVPPDQGTNSADNSAAPGDTLRAGAPGTFGADRRSWSRGLRGDLDWIVMKCLEKDRSRRYATANALADDLGRYLNGDPVDAGPPTAVYRMRKFVGRHRPLVAAVAAIALSLAAGFLATAVQWRRAERSLRTAERERSRAELALNLVGVTFESLDPDKVGAPARAALKPLIDRANEIQVQFAHQPDIEADIRAKLGARLLDLGDYEAAGPQLDRVLELCLPLYGERSDEAAAAMNDVAMVQAARGDFAGAERLLRRALATQQALHGPTSFPAIEATRQLAWSLIAWKPYRSQGGSSEALSILQPLIPILRAAGAGHEESLARALHELGQAHHMLGEQEEAIRDGREAVEILSRVCPGTTTLADIQAVVANYFTVANRREEARSMLTGALEAQTRFLGPEHPLVGNTKSLLADASDGPVAERLYREAANILVHGDASARSRALFCLQSLVGSFVSSRQFDQVIATCQEALALCGGTPHDPPAPYFRQSLAAALRETGRIREGEELLGEYAQLAQTTKGQNSIEAQHAAEAMAKWYQAIHDEPNATVWRERAAAAQAARTK